MRFREKVDRTGRQHRQKLDRYWLSLRQARTETTSGLIGSLEPKSPPLFDVLTGKERILPGK